MRFALLVLVAGCFDPPPYPERPDAAAVVGETTCDDVDYVWADVEASAPSGSLAAFHYAYAYWATCGIYFIAFRQQPRCVDPVGPMFTLGFDPDGEPQRGDVIPAFISISDPYAHEQSTSEATFTVGSFAPNVPGDGKPSFAGRFETTAPGWTVGLNVDVKAQFGESCTLL